MAGVSRIPPRLSGRPAAERRRRDLEQVQGAVSAESIVKGRLTVVGGGDVAVDINFPVLFTEKPHMTFGGEVKGTVDASAGAFPTISVLVGQWRLAVPDESDDRSFCRRFYIGAQLLVAIDGSIDVIAHYQFSGVAITNPTGSFGSLTTDSSI